MNEPRKVSPGPETDGATGALLALRVAVFMEIKLIRMGSLENHSARSWKRLALAVASRLEEAVSE